MAEQSSIITLKGNVGRLNFYKTKDGFQAREKGGVSKARIMSDPRYARTRENLKEFAQAASGVKLIKNAIRPALVRSSDSKLHYRLQAAVMRVVKSDPLNSRGERQIAEGNWDFMIDTELNRNASLTQSLKVDFAVSNTAGAFTVAFPAFKPVDLLNIPEGTTHFRIYAIGASMEFNTPDRTTVREDSTLLSVSEDAAAFQLAIDKSTLTDPHRLFLLGIEYVQQVNGQEYAINSGLFNAAVVLLSERS